MNLLVSFRSELLKTRRTATFYFTLIAAAAIPCLFILGVWVDGSDINEGEDPFPAILRMRFEILCAIIFPMFIMLICTLLAQVEYRNNTWKQVFASPQPLINVFIARFLNVHMLILLFLLLFNGFLVMSIVATHFMIPSIHLLDGPVHWEKLLNYNANAYISILGISAIQFWLSLRFRNFIIPLGIGLAMWIMGVILVAEYHKAGAYFPYTHTAYTAFPKFDKQLSSVRWWSLGYMAAFLVLGYVSFRKKRR